ncbi:MAG: DUF1592 domain-containing protein [Pseudomonadota bacterium]
MKPRVYQLAACLLALFCLAGMFSSAQAATGAAVPSFVYPILHIPRIDVEGYGALDVNMVLENQTTLSLALSSAQPANSAVAPGATYDLHTGILDIPQLRMGANLYAVQLKSTGNNKFQVTQLTPIAVTGQASYTQMCAGCHGIDGLGGPVKVTLKNCVWCKDLTSLTNYISINMPLGNPSLCVNMCASEVATYISTAFNGGSNFPIASTLEAIEVMPAAETLRKASMQLVSRLPTQAEIDLANSGGDEGLRSAVAAMMEEPAFYERLDEIFNDMLLTDHYLYSNTPDGAINLMGAFPSARWYDPGATSGLRDATYTANRITTNDSVAREPLELINHIVKNNLPATEMLTADYFMLNGYSAKSYGITDVAFNNEWDAKEFRPARLAGIPHAGILSSLMFLNRYPSTVTNRNRARARVVYDLFLDVDILGLDGARPNGSAVDIISKAPTMENPDCVKCHSLLDPVASSFQEWNVRGKYAPPTKWYQDMFQAGFGNQSVPVNLSKTPLQWLASQVAADPRFDNAMIRIIYKGLTGEEPLESPGASATTAETEAYMAESSMLDAAKAQYRAENRNLKTLIREIILSPHWRADGLKDTGFALVHADTGAARILTPEMMHRKLNALFGFEWRGPLDAYSTNKNLAISARLLEPKLYFEQIYGGIDSFNVSERPTDPNGLMANVQERMANEMACYAVPNDFLAGATSRRLFPYVETSTTLLDAQGQAAVMANLQHLHHYLLGEDLALDSAELAYTYQLFATVLQDGQSRLASKVETAALPARCVRTKDMLTGVALNTAGLTTDPNYVVRSWMAVVAYLLADYRFVYE